MCIVGVFNAEGPPVPIPNTEVKLCSGENTCLETGREDSSMPTHTLRFMLSVPWFVRQCRINCKQFISKESIRRTVGDLNAEGPPVPIPNTEVKLCCGENTCLETDREDSSMPTSNPFSG